MSGIRFLEIREIPGGIEMKVGRIVVVASIAALLIAFALVQPVGAEKPDKPKKDGVQGVKADGVPKRFQTDGCALALGSLDSEEKSMTTRR